MTSSGWVLFATGGNHRVSRSPGGDQVRKEPIDPDNPTEKPKRGERMWNLFNPDIPASVSSEDDALICPFVKGKQATAAEIYQALITVYNDTGRILADPTYPKNFIKEDKTGKIRCIDPNLALQAELREDKDSDFKENEKTRRKSIVSIDFIMDWTLHMPMDEYFAEIAKNRRRFVKNPKIIHLQKALMMIKTFYPDLKNVNFLLNNDPLVDELAREYDACCCNKTSGLKSALESLEKIIPDISSALKENAANILTQYINLHNLILAIKNNSVEEIQTYLNNISNINEISMKKILVAIIENKRWEAFKPIHLYATSQGQEGRLDDLYSIAIEACIAGELDIIKYLVPTYLTVAKGKNNILLEKSTDQENTDILEYLLAHNADIKKTDHAGTKETGHKGNSALHWAIKHDRLNIVEYLIENGADISHTNDKKETVLHWAVYYGNYHIVSYLVSHLISQNIKLSEGDQNNETALEWAERKYVHPKNKKNIKDIIKILRNPELAENPREALEDVSTSCFPCFR